MRLLKIAILVLGISASLSPVFAAGDVNQSGELGLFTLRSGHTYAKGAWGFSLYGNEWDWRVPSDEFWEDFDPLWSNWDLRHRRASAGVGFGLTDRFELDFMLPYEWYKAGHVEGINRSVGHLYGHTYVGEIDSSGWGDVRVGATWGLSSSDDRAFALRGFVDAPTGDDDEGVVTGELGWGLGLAWSAGNFVVNADYHDLGDPDIVENVPLRGPIEQEVSPRVELGVGYAAPIGDRWEWITELSGDIMTESTGEYDTADITSGGRFHFGADEQWAFNVALRIDISHNDLDDTSPIGGLVGISYSSPTRPQIIPRDQPPPPPPPPVAPRRRPTAPPPPPPAGPATHALTVRKTGTGNGQVTSNPAGIDCGSDCNERYAAGTAVRLTGKPDACSTFDGFSGDCARDGSVTMSSDRTCTAAFNVKPTQQTFAACEKYGAWDCQSGLRETVPFTTGGAMLGPGAVTAAGRGVLCDWANQLRACPQLRLCVAGSTAASEEACIASQRSDVLVQFFRRQSGESAFSGIASRVQAAPSCSAEDEKGSLGNLQMR